MGWWDTYVHMMLVCVCVCVCLSVCAWSESFQCLELPDAMLHLSWEWKVSHTHKHTHTHTHWHIFESIIAQSGCLHAYYWPLVCIYISCSPWHAWHSNIYTQQAYISTFGTVCVYSHVLCVQTQLTYRACMRIHTYVRICYFHHLSLGRPSVWPPPSCGGARHVWGWLHASASGSARVGV